MKNKMKLALFDFDGVLVDTLGIAYGINNEEDPSLSIETYKSFFEGNIHSAIAEGRKKHIPDFADRYSLQARELKIPEELRQLVISISEYSTLSIISSSETSVIKEILDREKISSYFSDILGSDVHQSKVSKISNLLKKYNTSPEDSVFVTDTLGDIKEAQECGVPAIAVTWGFHDESTLKRGNPVKIAYSPSELLEAINNMLKYRNEDH